MLLLQFLVTTFDNNFEIKKTKLFKVYLYFYDLKRFKYLKRLFRKYVFTGDLNIRLVVNHIIVLQNVFGVEAAVTLLLYKLDMRFWPALKSVLDYLNYLYPHELQEVEGDMKVWEILKGL